METNEYSPMFRNVIGAGRRSHSASMVTGRWRRMVLSPLEMAGTCLHVAQGKAEGKVGKERKQ